MTSRPSPIRFLIRTELTPFAFLVPKGGWEPGETLEQAAAREAFEEGPHPFDPRVVYS